MYCINKVFNSGIFQGKNKRKNYFEGWYFKLTDQSMEHTVAVIPGIAMGKSQRDAHAFIQVLLGGKQVCYYKFDLEEFQYNRNRFAIKIADNYFSENKLTLNLKGNGIQILGTVQFNHMKRLPKSLYMPGIMGPFSYIPWMECYHGVISMHHDITGQLMIADERTDFTGGCGYIEKDWGNSFPSDWVWLQTNHFLHSDGTLMVSAARIPMLGTSFPGFLALLRLGNQCHVFATYTGAKLRTLQCSDHQIKIILEDRRYRLVIQVASTEGGYLKAPHKGLMNRTIQESISNKAKIRLFDKRSQPLFNKRSQPLSDKRNQPLFEDTARNIGLEIVLPRHTGNTLN